MDTKKITQLESFVKLAKDVAEFMRWGIIEIEFKDGKAVFLKVKQETKLN